MASGHRQDLAWGVLSQFLQYGSALLVLPLLVTRLAPAEVGLWFVFVAIQSLVNLLDFGFSPTFSRNFAFVFAGVQDLQKEGVGQGGGGLNADLLGSVVATCRTLYAGIAAVMVLVMAGPGTWYLHTLVSRSPEIRQPWLAWGIFGVGVAVNIFFTWYSPLLVGAGKVRESYKVGILNRGGFALLAMAVLLRSGGLVGVSSAYLASVLISRIYAGMVAKSLLVQATPHRSLEDVRRVLGAVWHNSYRSGVVLLGGFLITRFSVFVVSSYLGLAASARYSVTIQIFSVILSVSQVALITFMPRFSACRVTEDWAQFRRLFLFALTSAWGLFIFFSIGVAFYGNPLLIFIHSRTLLLDRGLLLLMACVWLLEVNHAVAAAVITTGNTVPFMKASIWSGVASCVLSILVFRSGWGLGAVIAVQGLVQLAYNNWKWPCQIFGELELSAADFVLFLPRLLWARRA